MEQPDDAVPAPDDHAMTRMDVWLQTRQYATILDDCDLALTPNSARSFTSVPGTCQTSPFPRPRPVAVAHDADHRRSAHDLDSYGRAA